MGFNFKEMEVMEYFKKARLDIAIASEIKKKLKCSTEIEVLYSDTGEKM